MKKVKRFTKRTLCMVMTMLMLCTSVVSSGALTASAAETTRESSGAGEVAAFFIEAAAEKLLETGERALAEGLDLSSEAAGGTAGEVISFINDWVFKSAEEVAIAEIAELCEEILDRLTDLKQYVLDGDSAISGQVAQTNAQTYYDNMQSEWTDDVTNVLDEYHVSILVDDYNKYMQKAVDYANGEATEEDVQNARDTLTYDFKYLYNSSISSKDDSVEGIKNLVFTSADVKTNFYGVIYSLAEKMISDDNHTNYPTRCAIAAYYIYGSSSEQYEFVYYRTLNYISQILNVVYVYEEYLAQEYEYFTEKS